MAMLRRAVLLLSLALFPAMLYAQSADVQITATDSPDPVGPDGNITYTVTVTNAGPNAAANTNMSVILNNTLLYQSITTPAGWSCPSLPVNSGGSFTCTSTTLAASSTSVFTVVLKAAQSQIGNSDQTLNQLFTASGSTSDPNNGNNAVTVQTAYVVPKADLAITATDSPDPVGPDGNITYTVTVTNNGPNAATTANMSVVLNNTLLYQSVTTPAGWTCPSPPVNSGGSFSCTASSVPASSVSVFTVVLKAAVSQLGINDQTLNQAFTVGSATNDPVGGNNAVQVQTSYVTPKADLAVTATDSPDPVAPDGNITYTVTVTNNGPDAASSAGLSVPMNNTLLYQSVAAPAGWTCPSLSPGYGGGFTCTNPSFAPGTQVFTIVLKAAQSQFGNFSQTITQNFNIGANTTDSVQGNNSVNVTTQYVVTQSDIATTATDAPDPVTPGNNITYSITVTNNGPDAAPTTQLDIPLASALLFQSISGPGGWTCTGPTVNTNGPVNCKNPSMAVGSAQFTLVAKVNPTLANGPGGTIPQNFIGSSNAQDTVNGNNVASVSTTYTTLVADLEMTNVDTPDPVTTGGTITYTQTITNHGPDTATNAFISETLPATVTFQSLSAPGGWSCTTPAVGASGAINCSIASLANGASATFTLKVTVVATSGTIVNTVTADSATWDNLAGNDSATATTSLPAVLSADLGITKSTISSSAAPGGSISYTITLTNHGPDAAASAVMTDALPASLLFQSIVAPAGWSCTTPAVGGNGTITCSAATLANGASAAFTLVTTVAANATGTISNSAAASSAASDPVSGNSSGASGGVVVGAAASADLSLTKTTTSTQAVTGSNIDYTITASNAGPSAATNVVVTDTLPPGVQYVSATPSQGSCSGTTTITCNLGTLANGATATVAVRVLVVATTGTVSNTASVSASESDPSGGNNASTAPPLTVVAGPPGPAQVPTLSEWALLALAGLLAGLALLKMRL